MCFWRDGSGGFSCFGEDNVSCIVRWIGSHYIDNVDAKPHHRVHYASFIDSVTKSVSDCNQHATWSVCMVFLELLQIIGAGVAS